jgi:AraC family transcriptional regulator
VHFHPPGGLRLPADGRSSAMDVLVRMYDHHIALSRALLAECDHLDAVMLDRVIEMSVDGIDHEPTLRSLLDRTVRQLEMWSTAVLGGTDIPAGGTSVRELHARLDAAEPLFRAEIVEPVHGGRADEMFVDATCTPPQTFTLGGVLAHVLTFAAVRRTMMIGALERAGVAGLGAGDPMNYVGGAGADASTISRNFAQPERPASASS